MEVSKLEKLHDDYSFIAHRKRFEVLRPIIKTLNNEVLLDPNADLKLKEQVADLVFAYTKMIEISLLHLLNAIIQEGQDISSLFEDCFDEESINNRYHELTSIFCENNIPQKFKEVVERLREERDNLLNATVIWYLVNEKL